MGSPYIMAPRTGAEQCSFSQLNTLDRFFNSCRAPALGAYSMSCAPTSSLDVFGSRLDDEFILDWPVFLAVLPEMASKDPQGTAQMMVEVMGDQLPKDEAKANQVFERLWAEAKEATVGGGNVLGNTVTSAEIALRAAWKAQVRLAIRGLATGRTMRAVKLTPHITLEPFKIGKGGELRKGAAIKVRIRGLPMNVMHSLPAPVVMKAGGQFGTIRANPASVRSVISTADAITNARIQSSRFLRAAGAKGMPGVLAFGPSAILDLKDSTTWTENGASVNWKGFAVRSAASQSGNAVGMAAGFVVTAGVGMALGVVAAGSLPVLVVAFGVGLIAQVAWNYSGAQTETANWVEGLLK